MVMGDEGLPQGFSSQIENFEQMGTDCVYFDGPAAPARQFSAEQSTEELTPQSGCPGCKGRSHQCNRQELVQR